MATDPNLLMALVNAPTLAGQSVFSGYDQGLQRRQQQQALQANALQLAQAQQQQQYQVDVSGFTKDPTPQNLMNLIAKYPKQYEALQAGWRLKDNAQRTADLGFFSDVHGALSKGNTKLAISALEQRLAAEKKAGIDTSQEEAWLEQLRGGDPNAVNAVKALALGQIAAATGPDQFSNAYKAVGEGDGGDKRFVVGRALVDSSGNALYRDPEPTRYLENRPEGYTAVDPNTGATVSGGEGRYTGGWTPRARNGGDNDDAAVDGKIAGMSRALGIDPTAPFPPGTSNMDIARALTLSEGGPGSIADRNNNPGNLRDSRTGEFRKFPTKEAGLAAAAAQVARNRARGQNTIQSMVEGLPAGGRAQSGVIGKGGSAPSRMTPQEVAREGLDPNVVYYRNKDGIPQPVGGQAKSNAQFKPIPQPVANKIQPSIDTRDTLDWAVPSFRPEYAGHTILGDLSNDAQAILGTGPEGQRDWWKRIYDMDNVVRNSLFGSALTATEKAAWERTTVSPRMQPRAVISNLKQRQGIIHAALARQERFLKANKYDPEAVDALLSPLDMNAATQQAAPAGRPQFKIVARRPAR